MERSRMSMEDTSSPLSLVEYRRLQWLLGCLLVLVSAGSILFLEIEAAGLLGLIILSTLLVLVRADLPARIPTWAHRLVFPAILVLLGVDLWSGEGPLPAFVRLSLWLLLYRALCHRRRREDLQLILLGLFLIVIAGVLTVSIAFVVLLVAFTLCALALLLVVTLADAMAGTQAVDAGWHEGYRLAMVLRRLREVFNWKVAFLGLGLFGLLMLFSGLLFVSIPRFQLQNAFFLEKLLAKRSSTGFSDSIQFGEVVDIARNTGLAFTVDMAEGAPVPSSPYFRMQVLDEYVTGGGFKASAQLRHVHFQGEQTLAVIEGPPRKQRADKGVWTIYLEPGVARCLPLASSYTRIRLRDAMALRHAAFLRVVELRNDPLSMVPYRVEGWLDEPWVEDHPFARRPILSEGAQGGRLARRQFLELPHDTVSLEALTGFVEKAGLAKLEPEMFSEKASGWLQERHSYGLQSKVASGEGDLLVRWLGGVGPGHCEYFASGFVALARAAGHPSRVVVGFHGGDWNPLSNSFSVRFSDAHAWAEIWDGKSRWLRVDPTPGNQATGEEMLASARRTEQIAGPWAARMEALRVLWYRRIVNFDQQSQYDFLEGLRLWLKTQGERLKAYAEEAKGAFLRMLAGAEGAPSRILVGVVAVGCVALVWLLARLLRPWRWRLRGFLGGASRMHPVRREAGRLLEHLGEQGQTPPDGPSAVEAALLRLRYGAESSWDEPTDVFQQARLQLRRAKSLPKASRL